MRKERIMKIGILQTGHFLEGKEHDHGEFSDMFARFLDGKGFDFAIWNVVDSEFPASTSDADGWLVTGSRYSVYDEFDWIGRLLRFLRQCYRDQVPVVGVCFGHQALATALGGTVEKFSGGWAVGRTEYDWNGRRVALNAWHQDQIVVPPECADVIGTSDFCKYAMLSYGDRALSIQPHPEFSADVIDALIENRACGIVPDELLDRARNGMASPTDSSEFADLIASFFNAASARTATSNGV